MMSKKLVIHCSYDEKHELSNIKLSPLYLCKTDEWRLNYLNEIIAELEFEKNFILNNLKTS